MRLFFLTGTRVGDAVLSTGLLDHLLSAYPGARVTVAVGRPAASLFAAVPGLERVIVVQKRRRGAHWLDLWRRVALRRWSVAVDLRGSALTHLLWAGRRIVTQRADRSEHRVVELGRLIGCNPPPAPRLWLTEAHRAAARALLPAEPFLALAPTANWIGKQWPAEHFATVARHMTAPGGPLPKAPVVVFGAENERAMALPLLQAALPGGLVDLIGRTDLPLAGACLERARLFIGNDSGLMHLAAAAGAPTLGLFGPSPDARYAPWGARSAVVRTEQSLEEIHQRPDYHWITTKSFMDTLSVEKVEAAAMALLERT